MNRAIFVIGGPGSGKDIVIKEVLSKFDIKEYNIEQIKNIKEISENIIVSANANTLEKISSAVEILESFEVKSSAIYVEVLDKISKERLAKRNLQESVRKQKLKESKANKPKYKEIFENFFIFKNNNPSDSEITIKELKSLEESISGLIKHSRKQGKVNLIQSLNRQRQHTKELIQAERPKLSSSENKDLSRFNKYKSSVLNKGISNLRDRLKHQTEELYTNFKKDKESVKNKKLDVTNSIFQRTSFGPTSDLRVTGDNNLVQTYSGIKTESIDSPNASDSGLFGGMRQPAGKEDPNGPLFGYEVGMPKNPNRKKNFEKSKESKNEEVWGRAKNILFKNKG